MSADETLRHLNLAAWGVGAWFAASIVQRLVLRRPLTASPHPQARFVERWASGRANESFLSRFGAARHCLQVQVVGDELQVQPHFPLTLGFVPEVYDLERRIPLARIEAAVIVGGRHAQAVEIRYTTESGTPRNLLLLLRRAEAFLAVLGPRPAAA